MLHEFYIKQQSTFYRIIWFKSQFVRDVVYISRLFTHQAWYIATFSLQKKTIYTEIAWKQIILKKSVNKRREDIFLKIEQVVATTISIIYWDKES